MEINNALSVAVLVLAVALVASWIYFWVRNFLRNNKRDPLIIQNIFLLLGKKEKLSYKKIVEFENRLKKCYHKAHHEKEFSELVLSRVINDINSITSFADLKAYMKGYEQFVCPTLLNIHEKVVKQCNAQAGLIFSDELSKIIQTLNSKIKLQGLRNFIEELELPQFRGFAYQRGNVIKAQKFLKDLSNEPGEKSLVVDIQTASGLKEKEA
jgi:hypothetical protein